MSTRATGAGPLLHVPEDADRDLLASFVARVVRLEGSSLVRLRADGDGLVVAWATTPFGILVTGAVPGELWPTELTVPARELLTALAVVRGARVDPGDRADGRWPAELPPPTGWRTVTEVTAAELATPAERGIARAAQHGVRPRGLPDEVLDETALTLDVEPPVRVPMRCLLALSGMGFLDTAADAVRVSVAESWLRLDTPLGAAVLRRYVLPLSGF